ncbi:hypothetical protein [Thermosulfurimonas sp.]|uniref:hypothetical protein n=1 Tax=Thermosulfurimonas sp. TaxID=2080236 RepID=UPI0025FF92FB|nr:hypothetical protein [Thermosulfurimonas sp.]
MEIILKDQEIRPLLEEILCKLLLEKKDLLKEVITEVIEDVALSRAIAEGRKNKFVTKKEVLEEIESKLK